MTEFFLIILSVLVFYLITLAVQIRGDLKNLKKDTEKWKEQNTIQE